MRRKQTLSRNDGKKLEATVARIQQMMDPNTTVTRNEVLIDRLGNKREFDVVIRGSVGGRALLGVIECRDHKRRKGPAAVEGFAKKCENLNANLRTMVSRGGFTKQALVVAKHEGIGCLSLLPDDPLQVGFGIGDMWYGVHLNAKMSLTVHFASTPAPEIQFDPLSVKHSGIPVIHWFMREYFGSIPSDPYDAKGGTWTRSVSFRLPVTIEINNVAYTVRGLDAVANSSLEYKRQFVLWTGDAFYDWHAERFTIPPAGRVVGSSVDTHMIEGWTTFEGPLPERQEGIGLARAILYVRPQWPDNDPVVELDKL
jgi:hypothetical protein